MPGSQPQFVGPFPKRLKLARLLRELSHQALGRRAGIPPRAIERYEGGGAMPALETLVRLAKALDVPTDYLLGLVDVSFPCDTVEITGRNFDRLSDGDRELARRILRMLTDCDQSAESGADKQKAVLSL